MLAHVGEVFVGAEAVATGRVTRHELGRWYEPIARGVYVPKSVDPTLKDRAVGAWLAAGRRGAIAGVAASALYGAPWVDDDHPIEILGVRCKPQDGLISRLETAADDEITRVAGLPVTTRVRTARLRHGAPRVAARRTGPPRCADVESAVLDRRRS